MSKGYPHVYHHIKCLLSCLINCLGLCKFTQRGIDNCAPNCFSLYPTQQPWGYTHASTCSDWYHGQKRVGCNGWCGHIGQLHFSVTMVVSCWGGWKWIGCSMWSFSIFMISSQNKLFYLYHLINTLDNNPFVLTAVSSNIEELRHSLLLYGILLSSCELISGSQQKFYKLWLNVLTVRRSRWPHHPLHPTPFCPWYQSLQVLARA